MARERSRRQQRDDDGRRRRRRRRRRTWRRPCPRGLPRRRAAEGRTSVRRYVVVVQDADGGMGRRRRVLAHVLVAVGHSRTCCCCAASRIISCIPCIRLSCPGGTRLSHERFILNPPLFHPSSPYPPFATARPHPTPHGPAGEKADVQFPPRGGHLVLARRRGIRVGEQQGILEECLEGDVIERAEEVESHTSRRRRTCLGLPPPGYWNDRWTMMAHR